MINESLEFNQVMQDTHTHINLAVFQSGKVMKFSSKVILHLKTIFWRSNALCKLRRWLWNVCRFLADGGHLLQPGFCPFFYILLMEKYQKGFHTQPCIMISSRSYFLLLSLELILSVWASQIQVMYSTLNFIVCRISDCSCQGLCGDSMERSLNI